MASSKKTRSIMCRSLFVHLGKRVMDTGMGRPGGHHEACGGSIITKTDLCSCCLDPTLILPTYPV